MEYLFPVFPSPPGLPGTPYFFTATIFSVRADFSSASAITMERRVLYGVQISTSLFFTIHSEK